MYPFAQNRASPEFAPGIPNSNGRPYRIVVVIFQADLPALSNDPVIVIPDFRPHRKTHFGRK